MTRAYGPERPAGQGLDRHQEESGNRAIAALLGDDDVRSHVDLVITHRDDAYEVWAARGMVRYRRLFGDQALGFEVVETIGENPIADQRHTTIATCSEELEAARASGFPCDDPNVAFIEPHQLSYPFAYERIAQLFDSPNAPDLIVSPKCYTFGLQPGQHGALDIVQSRAPLAFAGPGVRAGCYEQAVRHVDIAPTICRLMGFPMIDGCDASGRRASERGVAPDVYLERQDGRVLAEILAAGDARPELVYLVLFDGLSNSELRHLLEQRDPRIRNLRRILDRSASFPCGSIVNFPSITWPSHSAILTGAWCGHHDLVNPAYYLRATRQAVAPQAQGMMTESFLGAGVETLYEAFRRVHGARGFTASIHEPQGRGATHAALERRVVGRRDRLKRYTDELMSEIHPRYASDRKEGTHREAILDVRGLAQVIELFDDASHPLPMFVAHELAMTDGAGHDYGPHSDGLRTAIEETDRRLGRVLDLLEAKGLFERCLFVFTSDHGMAAQDVALRANPARHPERIGMKAITAEPMIWLQDMAIEVEAAPDGRTGRVMVTDNDARSYGDEVAVADAEVTVYAHEATARRDVHRARVVARVTTNAVGLAGFTTPADIPPHQLSLSVSHPNYNPRHLRLDGTNLIPDLREQLYQRSR